MAKLVKRYTLTTINSVTVETETDPGLGYTTSASPRTCGRCLENPVSTVRTSQEGKIEKEGGSTSYPEFGQDSKPRSELTFILLNTFSRGNMVDLLGPGT
jgi:hypothetical protein